jgi:hypothetical protein
MVPSPWKATREPTAIQERGLDDRREHHTLVDELPPTSSGPPASLQRPPARMNENHAQRDGGLHPRPSLAGESAIIANPEGLS